MTAAPPGSRTTGSVDRAAVCAPPSAAWRPPTAPGTRVAGGMQLNATSCNKSQSQPAYTRTRKDVGAGMPNNPNKLSQLWARVVGLKEWNREADALHNTV